MDGSAGPEERTPILGLEPSSASCGLLGGGGVGADAVSEDFGAASTTLAALVTLGVTTPPALSSVT